MAIEVTLLELGEDAESCDVLSICVAEGEVVSAGQDLIEVETGKATVPIPSPFAGQIVRIRVTIGDTIQLGDVIAEIEVAATSPRSIAPGAGEPTCVREEGEAENPTAELTIASQNKPIDGDVGDDQLAGTYSHADSFGNLRVEKMSRLRQTIARNMTISCSTIPQLTSFDEADVTELDRVRRQMNSSHVSQGTKLTVVPFLVKAVVAALRQFPVVNASVDMESHEVRYKEYINIGIAVDTDRGLLVPVLREADQKTLEKVASELTNLAGASRSGEIRPDSLRGATFTISNLGSIGGVHATPIINPPEAAILLVGAARPLPRVIDDAIQVRLMMPLSLTYDHRIIDGAVATRFLIHVRESLAAPEAQLLS